MKFVIDIKEHKVPFVIDLLEKMSFVSVTPMKEEESEKEEVKE